MDLMKGLQKLVGLCVMLAGLVPSAEAGTVRIVNLMEMVAAADRVFLGKCLAVELETEASLGLPVVAYTFRVTEGIKGVEAGQTVVFRQVRRTPAGVGIGGLPQYFKGQEVILFLHADSPLGLTSPVGFGQGVFRLVETPLGEVGAINSLDNRNLGLELPGESLQEAGLTSEETQSLAGGEAVPLRLFQAVVEKMDRLARDRGFDR